MRFTEVIEKEYENVSETVVDKLVSPKKMEKLEYEIMPEQSTYAEGVHALRDSYKRKQKDVPSHLWYEVSPRKILWYEVGRPNIVRPLTFRENILARVEDFETLKNKDGSTRTMEERLRLFRIWIDSCTGIAYSSHNNDDFMIIPVCKELITIPKDFSNEYLSVNYARLQGRGFSLKRSQAKYDQQLTELEVISHPAWITCVEEDISLLGVYTSIVFKHMSNKNGKAMAFYLKERIENDQLINPIVYSSFIYSSTYGNYNLDGYSFFLRATPPS